MNFSDKEKKRMREEMREPLPFEETVGHFSSNADEK